jgi:putative hydroxymethylpyrimidine transporter CytX
MRSSPFFFSPERSENMDKKTSVWENSLIWFGAAVSLAEIFSGTLFAPLGFTKGLMAILLGHVIGCLLLYGAGLIGALTGKSAMETVGISFGKGGGSFFAVLNVIQLIGWTAVMIAGGATALTALVPGGTFVWCIVLGILVLAWVFTGTSHVGKINTVAMGLLFVLTLVLSALIFGGGNLATPSGEALSFGAAVELSVAMPLSWLPLLADYTRHAEKPYQATAASCVVYGLVSCWMYIIGMGMALFAGSSDLGTIMLKAGMGLGALIIILLSTVTTTCLDVYSAAISSSSISKRISSQRASIMVCIIGTLLAALAPTSKFEDFLYFIGSVFAPMTAILLTDYFLLGRKETKDLFGVGNLCLWIIGFILYRYFLNVDTPLGSTIPVMVIMMVVCYVVNLVAGRQEEC